MATGGRDQSIKGGHEMFFECRCNTCEEKDCMAEAVAYCRDCNAYYCVSCLRDHNKFVILRQHTVLGEADKDDWGESKEPEYMAKARDMERELRSLKIEKARAEAMLEDLQVRADRQEENATRLRAENANLNHDLDQLIGVISTARTAGRWEIKNVGFRELSIEQVFGSLHESLGPVGISDDSSKEIRELREQLKKKNELVSRLQADLEHVQRQRVSGETQMNKADATICQLRNELASSKEDHSRYSHDADEIICQLRDELAISKVDHSRSSHDVTYRERKIASLQAQISDLLAYFSHRETDTNSHM